MNSRNPLYSRKPLASLVFTRGVFAPLQQDPLRVSTQAKRRWLRSDSGFTRPVIPRELIRDPACYSTSVMRRTWTWTFDLPPDELWPLLADTNRFNEAMGLPSYVLEETPQANGTILRRGKGKAAGFTLEWEEKPYEWIHGRHFRQARVFTKGPFRRFGPVFDLEPIDLRGGAVGSKVSYALEWEPLTFMGRLFGARLAAQAGEIVAKRIPNRWPSPRARARPISICRRPSCPTARASGRARSPPTSTAAPTATASAGRWPTGC